MRARNALPVAAIAVAVVAFWLGGPLPWPARLFTAFLVAVLPLAAADPAAIKGEIPRGVSRGGIYLTSSIALWVLAGLSLLAALASGWHPGRLGLTVPLERNILDWSAVTTVAVLAMVFLSVRAGAEESPLLRYLLPRTSGEKAAFVGVSFSAGIAEEIVFRGFLIPALRMATGSLAGAVVVSSALFGMLHGYQGMAGMVRAGALGAVLAVPFLATGSLVPSMVAHTALDLVMGLGLGRRLLGPEGRE